MFNKIARAIETVACVLREYVRLRQIEFEWAKAHAITKQDLAVAKDEIIKAIDAQPDKETQKKLNAMFDHIQAGKGKLQTAIDANK